MNTKNKKIPRLYYSNSPGEGLLLSFQDGTMIHIATPDGHGIEDYYAEISFGDGWEELELKFSDDYEW